MLKIVTKIMIIVIPTHAGIHQFEF